MDKSPSDVVNYQPMEKLNEDHNLIGRVGAIVVIIAVAWGLARITGYCPLGCAYFKP